MDVDPGAFELGIGGEPRALLLHGLTGSPWDLRAIGESLASAGVYNRAPRLPGHRSVDRLAEVTWRDWTRASEQAFDRICRESDRGRGVVVGFSMGSLLALRLAALDPRVSAVAVLAVPLQLPAWQIRGAAALGWLHRRGLGRLLGHYEKRRGVDVRSRAEKRRNPGLAAFPYSSIAELGALQAEVRAVLPRVRAPILILHGRHDHAAPARHAKRVSQRVSSTIVRRITLPGSYHLLGRDVDRARVCEEITQFMIKHAGPGAPPSPSNPS
jgi:carboxylesterase